MTTAAPRLVKCVVWDIDNTLLDGVYLESGDTPPAANPAMAGALTDLASRGILHAIASKNPPQAAVHAARGDRCPVRGRGVRLGREIRRAGPHRRGPRDRHRRARLRG